MFEERDFCDWCGCRLSLMRRSQRFCDGICRWRFANKKKQWRAIRVDFVERQAEFKKEIVRQAEYGCFKTEKGTR